MEAARCRARAPSSCSVPFSRCAFTHAARMKRPRGLQGSFRYRHGDSNCQAVALTSHISLWQAESAPLDSAGFRSAPAGTFTQLSPSSHGSACRTRRVRSRIRQAGYARFVCNCGRRGARADGALADRPWRKPRHPHAEDCHHEGAGASDQLSALSLCHQAARATAPRRAAARRVRGRGHRVPGSHRSRRDSLPSPGMRARVVDARS